jgi:hypothetical protein
VLVLVGLLIFLGIKTFGGDDDGPISQPNPSTQPSTDPSNDPTGEPTTGPTDAPTGGPSGELGNATGQAKSATDKLLAAGYSCSDLFNGAQGAHRGCFKYDGATSAEVIYQFKADGTIIGVLVKSEDSDNVNNAQVTFDAALQAVGTDSFGGSEVAKVQQAVKTGQKTQKVGSTWGEFQLNNNGDDLQLRGGKSGSDSFDLPRRQFETTEAQLQAGLKAKQYTCTSSCRKTLGKYGSQTIYGIGSSGAGIRILEMRASGDTADVKAAVPTTVSDGFGAVKGTDAAALKAYIDSHSDGKSYASYVSGWRIEITANNDDDYSSVSISVRYESFYV